MKERLKTIKIIHFAICIGVALPYFLVGDLHKLNFPLLPEVNSSTLVYFLIPIAAIFLGNLLYKQQLKRVDTSLSSEEKIKTYQTASLIRWAVLEGAAFFLLFSKKEFLTIGLLPILYLVFLKPSEEAMKRDFDAVEK